MKFNSIQKPGFFLFLLIGIFISSCSDSVPTLERDKFIGEYDGELVCKGLLAATINGETTFSIDESSTSEDLVDITIQSNPVLRLEATVDQSDLNVNTFIPGVMISGTAFDITADGILSIDQSDTNISGDLNIKLESIITISDVCTITGTKK